MDRRKFLAGVSVTVATAAAGCLANDGDPDDAANDDGGNNDDTGTDDDSGGENGDGNDGDLSDEFERYVSVTAADDVPEDIPVTFDVDVLDGAITAEGTGLLEVSATNTGDKQREIDTPYYKGASENGGVLLYSLEAPDSPSRDSTPGCSDSSSDVNEWTDEGPLMHVLDPGETGRDELVVVDDPVVDGCLPAGEYRFERDHAVDGTEFTWGFTVEITEEPPDGTLEDPENRRYEECSREVIPYDQFPEDVRAEIDAALGGRYEADRVYLREAMDVTESFVSVDDEYYEATVSREGDQEVLELRHVEPKVLPKARPVKVEQSRDGERTITVEVVADDGTVLVEKTRDLQPGGDVEFGRTNRVGTHELRVTVANGDQVEDDVTKSLTISESRFSVLVLVEPDEIIVAGAVADLVICNYDT